MTWLHGYGQGKRTPHQPAAPQPQAAKQRAQPIEPTPIPTVAPITCPECESDQLRVRSSKPNIIRLECLSCAHEWTRRGNVRKVLVPAV